MTDDVRIYECPSPDCSRTFGAIKEFTEHIDTEHAGEYQRDDWPDTPAGRQARRDRKMATRSDDQLINHKIVVDDSTDST
ncbi:hypothetical protein C491_13247 [Natronococcus amylolyticus DSM 10524]|uniref:C2H2-type domain-containing protein n=1 Tax=Natronococcus amylolyticus DSM 10524 TaxID=1227497 RepID=L9X4I2_9EURY|nr:hypothetical protein [Natronococcus amylolyticus]ELY56507.1 hypothetical protein C491_13247 [Natronococcus amylolyticus DSM 10524]